MNKKVHKIIKKYRKKLKMTQEDLAKKLGVSSSLVSYWETKKGVPDKELIPKIAEALKISKRKFEELKYRNDMGKFKKVMQSIFEKSIVYVLVTILLMTFSTLIYNYKGNDLYYQTYRLMATTTDEKVIKEADKNLEIIKNSDGILDEKAKEDKEKMIIILEAFSYKLHNYKRYEGKNNYQYMEYMSKDFNYFDLSFCDVDYNNKCDIKEESMYSYPIQSLAILIRIDRKVNDKDISDRSYKPLDNYPYLKNNFMPIASAPNYSIVTNAYFPDLKIKNIYGYIINAIASYNSNLNIDQYYLELTKAVMEVGDIHE